MSLSEDKEGPLDKVWRFRQIDESGAGLREIQQNRFVITSMSSDGWVSYRLQGSTGGSTRRPASEFFDLFESVG